MTATAARRRRTASTKPGSSHGSTISGSAGSTPLAGISPRAVLDLLGWLAPQLVAAVEGADPRAVTQHVSWASDRLVPMWPETAREVAEYRIHRQHLLIALDRPVDLRADLLGPVLDALRWAFPYWLAAVAAPTGTTVLVDIGGAVTRRWWVAAGAQWDFVDGAAGEPIAALRLDADTAWWR